MSALEIEMAQHTQGGVDGVQEPETGNIAGGHSGLELRGTSLGAQLRALFTQNLDNAIGQAEERVAGGDTKQRRNKSLVIDEAAGRVAHDPGHGNGDVALVAFLRHEETNVLTANLEGALIAPGILVGDWA